MKVFLEVPKTGLTIAFSEHSFKNVGPNAN
jgi:hypothetical protein